MGWMPGEKEVRGTSDGLVDGARTCSKRACLSGKDIADMLEGKVITAFGVEFVYDGVDIDRIRESAETLGRKSSTKFRATPQGK